MKWECNHFIDRLVSSGICSSNSVYTYCVLHPQISIKTFKLRLKWILITYEDYYIGNYFQRKCEIVGAPRVPQKVYTYIWIIIVNLLVPGGIFKLWINIAHFKIAQLLGKSKRASIIDWLWYNFSILVSGRLGSFYAFGFGLVKIWAQWWP